MFGSNRISERKTSLIIHSIADFMYDAGELSVGYKDLCSTSPYKSHTFHKFALLVVRIYLLKASLHQGTTHLGTGSGRWGCLVRGR